MRLTPKKQVLKVIDDSPEPLTYKQVYKEIKDFVDIKDSTVRMYLTRLVQENKIMRYSKGLYCSLVTYGVMVGDLRVHNIRFNVLANFLGQFPKIDDVTEFFGDMKIFVQFGKQNRLLTGEICIKKGAVCKGFTKETLFLALDKALGWMENRTGHFVADGISISRFETNKDVGGTRLQESSYGQIGCFSRQEFFEVIECVYQKDDVTVRSEQRISRSLKVVEAVSILRGDHVDANVAIGLKATSEKVEQMVDCMKWQNRNFAEVANQMSLIVRDNFVDKQNLELFQKQVFNVVQSQKKQIGVALEELKGLSDDRGRIGVLEDLVGKLFELYKFEKECNRVNSDSLSKLSEMLAGVFGVVACKQDDASKKSIVQGSSGGNPFVC